MDGAHVDRGNLVITGDQGLEMAACEKEMRDAVGLVGGFDKEFADATNEIALGVEGFGAH